MKCQRIAAEEIEATVEEVLARPEFHATENLFEEKLGELFGGLGEGLAATSAFVAELVPFVLGVFLVFLVLRGLRASREASDAGGPSAGGPTLRERVSALVSQARRARVAGDALHALRLYSLALVTGLGARGDVRFREAWTNRELLRRGRPKAAARELLEELVEQLEAKEFGRAPIRETDFVRLEELCTEHLGIAPALAGASGEPGAPDVTGAGSAS